MRIPNSMVGTVVHCSIRMSGCSFVGTILKVPYGSLLDNGGHICIHRSDRTLLDELIDIGAICIKHCPSIWPRLRSEGDTFRDVYIDGDVLYLSVCKLVLFLATLVSMIGTKSTLYIYIYYVCVFMNVVRMTELDPGSLVYICRRRSVSIHYKHLQLINIRVSRNWVQNEKKIRLY